MGIKNRITRNSWQSLLGSNIAFLVGDDGEFFSIPTTFVPSASGGLRQMPMLQSGVIEKIFVQIDGNTLGDNLTLTTRVNSVDTLQIITITAGVNAVFQSSVEVPIVAGDLVQERLDFVNAAEAGTCICRANGLAGRE